MSLQPSSRQIVSGLPRQLLSFFRKHPPASSSSWLPAAVPGTRPPKNPFRPSKNTYTLKYEEPRYSIRRQTNLFNLAEQYHLAHLLPPRVPHKESKVGAVMKGLRQWKGTKMERTRDARIATINAKTAVAKKVVRARKARTKAKKRSQRTGLILD